MDHQGVYGCNFVAFENNLCNYSGSAALKVIKGPDVTTNLKTNETQSSSDVTRPPSVFGHESVLDKDTVVEGEPFTIRCSPLHVNGTVTCRSFVRLEIYMNRTMILQIKSLEPFPRIYHLKPGNYKSECYKDEYSIIQTNCKLTVKQARMDHQGVYGCNFVAFENNLCNYSGSATLKVIKGPDVTTSLKTNETQSSSDVSGSRHSEKRFSTTGSPSVMNTTDLQVTDESLGISLKLLIATATFVAMLGEVSFFTIAWIFWRKSRSLSVIRNLFQNRGQPSPKTAISHNPTNDTTSLGSDITNRCNQTIPDTVLDQHADIYPQPISRTELVYLAAQKTPGQELTDRTDLKSGNSSVNDEHQGIGSSLKII